MKKTTALAAVLAVTLMLGACSQTPKKTKIRTTETTETTVFEETTNETSEETTNTNKKEPNLIGNPDLSGDDWFYWSKDVGNSWVSELYACYGLLDWTLYSPTVAGSELTVELAVDTEDSYGSQVKLYIFEHNDDYEWNTDDAYISFDGDFCSTVNGDVYFCKTMLPKTMPTGVYTLVVAHTDGTVDCMYDFDIVATTEEAEGGEAVMKPVIYLYPEETTEVSVSVDFEGILECTYPQYDPEFGWKVVADPDGQLHNLNDGRDYDYLFWDGQTSRDLDSFNNAICVKGSDCAKFLEEYLEAAGLNSSEIDDFISFWLPMMEKNEYNLISFPTLEYEEMAKLNISPAPDTVIRVYMVFAGVDHEVEVPADKQLQMPEGVVRDGFTVVEWGGSPVEYEG